MLPDRSDPLGGPEQTGQLFLGDGLFGIIPQGPALPDTFPDIRLKSLRHRRQGQSGGSGWIGFVKGAAGILDQGFAPETVPGIAGFLQVLKADG
jgi:hypothetical protein